MEAALVVDMVVVSAVAAMAAVEDSEGVEAEALATTAANRVTL